MDQNRPKKTKPKTFHQRIETLLQKILRIKGNPERVKNLRRELGIPAGGFGYDRSVDVEGVFAGLGPNAVEKLSHLANSILDKTEFKQPKIVYEYFTAIEELVEMIVNGKLANDYVPRLSPILLGFTTQKDEVASIRELINKQVYEKHFFLPAVNLEFRESDINANFPFSINFRPETQLEDLVQFIKGNYHLFKEKYALLEQKEKGLLKSPFAGKRIAKDKNLEIEDIILANDGMRTYDLANLLNNKFPGIFTEKDVYLIRSRAKRKRKYIK